jgi:hypothetical protein
MKAALVDGRCFLRLRRFWRAQGGETLLAAEYWYTAIESNADPIGRRIPSQSMYPMMSTVSSVRTIPLFVALGILACTACTPAHAQSDDEPDIEDRWALQFQVTDNFNLSDFQGGLISAKKQYSARRAFRFGVDLSASVSRMDTDRDTDPNRERDQNRQTIGVNAQWIRYPVHEGRFRAYWGVGPQVVFNRSAISRDTGDGTDGSNDDRDVLSLSGGAIGVLGAEWFVRSRLSLSAEYRAGLSYQYARSDQGSTTDTQHQVSLGSRGVLVGVSLYF